MNVNNSRIAFLSSTSTRVAMLLSLGLMGLALSSPAQAQDECEPVGENPSANGDAPDSYVCTQSSYPGGITYNSDGDLVVTADVPVDPNWGVALLETGAAGVNLTGNGSDAVTWDSTGTTVSGQNGAIIDVTTQVGPINIRTDGVRDMTSSGGTTGAIRAVSQGGGAVSVSVASGFVRSDGGTSIEAVSQGGNGDVNIDISGAGFVNFAERGIYASAEGTGSVTINLSESSRVGIGSNTPNTVAIDAVSGSGPISINLIDAGVGNSSGGAAGTALRTNSGGDVVITLENGELGLGSSLVALDATIVSGARTTVTADASSTIQGDVRAVGAGALIVENNGRFEEGAFDLTGLTGGSTLTFGETSTWSISQSNSRVPGGRSLTNRFSAGDDVITSAGNIFIGGNSFVSGAVANDSLLFFGDGTDSFANSGALVINASPDNNPLSTLPQDRAYAGATVFTGLETFTNSGLILLGSRKLEDPEFGTDRWYDDVLSMPGTRWISDGGEVLMDVDLNRSQPDCTTRNADGDLGAADCIRLVGGSTEGVTNLTLIQTIPGDRGRYDPDGILLVDVAGGTSAQGDFVVGPNTPGYSSAYGGSIDKGVFNAFVLYDESSQQHRLVSLPGPTALQFPLLATAAQGLWRTTTGSWFDRQADLRGAQQDGLGGGVWLRVTGERADRDAIQTFSVGSQVVTADNSYKQTNTAINGGVDIIVGTGDNSAWVVGVMGGYGRAKMRFDNSPNRANFEGYTFGGYASLVSGGLFVDAAVNANILELEEDAPGLNLFPAGTLLATDVKSLGAQVEAGWRVPLTSSGLFVEPQLGLSYVRSNISDLVIPANDPTRIGVIVAFDDPTSFRGTLGGRFGIERPLGSATAELSLLGRVSKEFKGENSAALQNRGPDAIVTDTFDGEFGEVMLSASISSANQGVSGMLNLGGKFQSGYSAGSVSVGVRVKW